jgi:hypothetical protein
MRRPLLRSLFLAAIPFVGMCFSVALWDRVDPMVLGLPFNLVWITSWIPLTSLCIWLVHRIESRRPPIAAPKP